MSVLSVEALLLTFAIARMIRYRQWDRTFKKHEEKTQSSTCLSQTRRIQIHAGKALLEGNGSPRKKLLKGSRYSIALMVRWASHHRRKEVC